ncbi:MAG TPA: tetratricopeptide repeat protein, partial [Vicinamibacteria bacterium]
MKTTAPRAALRRWLLASACALPVAAARADPAVVMDTVAPKSAPEAAGLKPGDVLVAWSRAATAINPAAQGTLESPFDVADLLLEQIYRGPITLEGRRGDQAQSWTLPGLRGMRMRTRPDLGASLLAAHQEGKDLVAAKKPAEAAARWQAAAAEARRQGEPVTAVWLLSRAAEALTRAALWKEANEAHRIVVQEAEGLLRPSQVAHLERDWAFAFRDQEDLPRAMEHCRRALAHDEKAALESLAVALDLNCVGQAARVQMQLGPAEEAFRRALAISERLAPDSGMTALLLNSMGNVFNNRHESAIGEDYLHRALALQHQLSPGTWGEAGVMLNLGYVALHAGRTEEAERYFREALAIDEKVAPGDRDVASGHHGLAEVAKARREWAVAVGHYQQALAILEKGGAKGEDGFIALVLTYLGDVAVETDDLAAAEGYYRRAQPLMLRVNADTDDEALLWHSQALLARRRGRLDEAADHLRRSLDALESQRAVLGGSHEGQAGFFARYARYYHDSVEVLLALSRPADALQVVERSRARSLLALLAERGLALDAELPAELKEERRRLESEYDQAQSALAALDPERDTAGIADVQARLRSLREAREVLAERIRQALPRQASAHYPQPLDLDAVRRSLDPGTLFLTYAVGQDTTWLFAVEPSASAGPGLSVYTLPVGAAALQAKVQALRRGIESRRAPDRAALGAASAELYDLLLRPAEPRIAASARLLISPEGPLHLLPFAALRRGSKPGSYLVEWKPLTVVPSATVHAELRKARHQPGAVGPLVAFGDPRYPHLPPGQVEQLGDAEVRAGLRRGFDFKPLPATRREVEDIAALFPGRARKYLGVDATEGRAKAL